MVRPFQAWHTSLWTSKEQRLLYCHYSAHIRFYAFIVISIFSIPKPAITIPIYLVRRELSRRLNTDSRETHKLNTQVCPRPQVCARICTLRRRRCCFYFFRFLCRFGVKQVHAGASRRPSGKKVSHAPQRKTRCADNWPRDSRLHSAHSGPALLGVPGPPFDLRSSLSRSCFALKLFSLFYCAAADGARKKRDNGPPFGGSRHRGHGPRFGEERPHPDGGERKLSFSWWRLQNAVEQLALLVYITVIYS